MPIHLKSPGEIAAMRRAGEAAWSLIESALARARPGDTTAEVAARLASDIAAIGAEPILQGRSAGAGPPFPACCCICVNEEALHGIPGPRILRDGDVISVDLALRLDGWCADAASAAIVGRAQPGLSARLAAARAVVDAGIATMTPGARWSAVARAAEEAAASAGLRLAAGYAGHGIGRDLHEPPAAPLWHPWTGPEAVRVQDFALRPGMVLTIEPVLILGGRSGSGSDRPELVELDDGFTVVTGDRAPACHEERTVAVTREGPVVLTGARTE